MSSIDPVFHYSSRLLLDNHHLPTDNIKFISQQIVIARLRKGFDSLNDPCQWLQHTIQVLYSLNTNIFHVEHVSYGL